MLTGRENTMLAKVRAHAALGLHIYLCLPGGIIIEGRR